MQSNNKSGIANMLLYFFLIIMLVPHWDTPKRIRCFLMFLKNKITLIEHPEKFIVLAS